MLKNVLAIFCLSSSLMVVCHADDNADNSERNKMQIQNRELDASDQGNSKGDVDITAKIRQGVVMEKSLSTNAKNIKIITSAGQVTLKGPVKSVEEKNKIRMIATKIAGKDQVNDEIEFVNK